MCGHYVGLMTVCFLLPYINLRETSIDMSTRHGMGREAGGMRDAEFWLQLFQEDQHG